MNEQDIPAQAKAGHTTARGSTGCRLQHVQCGVDGSVCIMRVITRLEMHNRDK